MKNILFIFLTLAAFSACKNEDADKPAVPAPSSIDAIRKSEPISNSSLISNPISADSQMDLTQVPKMEFEKTSFDFGEIKEGEKVEHIFKFKNTGKSPLVISSAQGSCGCTVPEWPRSPIAPNETGEIKVKFNSEDKNGSQEKTVTLTANTNPTNVTLTIKGTVLENPDKKGDKK